MDFELISFKLCPFVQRAAIILHFKEIPFRTSYIDLANPPDWFRVRSAHRGRPCDLDKEVF